MDEEIPKIEAQKGVFILFESTGGRSKSRMKVNSADINEISNTLAWMEIVKEKLLSTYKQLIVIQDG